jgi:hypothetical protein
MKKLESVKICIYQRCAKRNFGKGHHSLVRKIRKRQAIMEQGMCQKLGFPPRKLNIPTKQSKLFIFAKKIGFTFFFEFLVKHNLTFYLFLLKLSFSKKISFAI